MQQLWTTIQHDGPNHRMAHQLDGGRYAGSPSYVFTGWGIVAGLLLVVAFTASFAAIPLVGISVGQVSRRRVILLPPPLPLGGGSMVTARQCQQTD